MTPWSVDVVVTTIGRPYLEDAVKSVMDVRIHDLKLIIIWDNCLPREINSTIDVVNVRGIFGNPGAARQAAYSYLSKDFVMFLDDDDMFDGDAINKLLSSHSPQPGVALAASWRYYGNQVQESRSINHDRFIDNYLKGDALFVLGSILFPRAEVQATPMRSELRLGQDAQFIMEIDRLVTFNQVLDPILLVRRHEGNRSASNTQNRLFYIRLWQNTLSDSKLSHVDAALLELKFEQNLIWLIQEHSHKPTENTLCLIAKLISHLNWKGLRMALRVIARGIGSKMYNRSYCSPR